MKDEAPDLSIIIVSWNVSDYLDRCLASVYANVGPCTKEVIVVDNASSDGSADLVAGKYKDARLVVNDENLGFAKACNQGIVLSRGKYILLLNPDTVLGEGFGKVMDFISGREDAGVVGCRMVGTDGKDNMSYQSFPTVLRVFTFFTGLNRAIKRPGVLKALQPVIRLIPSQARHLESLDSVAEVDSVIGAFFMFRRELTDRIGLLDENYFLYFEETDFCLKAMRAGYKNYFFPGYKALHAGGKSAEKASYDSIRHYARSLGYYFRKNHSYGKYLLVRGTLCVAVALRAAVSGMMYFFNDRARDDLAVYSRLMAEILR